jgi:hypothetical protein
LREDRERGRRERLNGEIDERETAIDREEKEKR